MHEELKFLHVMAVVLLGGAAIVDTMTGTLMPRMGSVAELRALTRVSRVNQVLGVASAILVPLFGYATAGDSDLDLGTGWLLWGQILFWIAVVIAMGIMTPGAIRLARKVGELPDGPVPEDVQAELKNPLFPALGTLLSVLFIVVVYLMVAQPEL